MTMELSATEAYPHGQVHEVMRSADGSGIALNDLRLIENDSPGAGRSEKGDYMEPVYAGVQVRKTFHLDDPRALAAHVVLYFVPRVPAEPAPYVVTVNGTDVPGIPLPWHEGIWQWVPIDPALLRAGENQVVLRCDAPEEKGYDLLFARADEYESGGGSAAHVGDTSEKSVDGGLTWTRGALGPANNVQGEYTIRLNLQRYASEGWFEFPAVDLYAVHGGIGVPGKPQNVTVDTGVDLPNETEVTWTVRYSPGEGRYAYPRVRFSTRNPLATPVLRSVRLQWETEGAAPWSGAYVRAQENPEILRSSYFTDFQDITHPELARLRERLGLDALVEGTMGDFEKINRVRHFVSTLWMHDSPFPDYPEWNAHEVLDRLEARGAGGMCMQFAVVFMQALQSLGYQARHVNLFNHESIEVWVDDAGKWLHVDPESLFDSYEYDTETGEPLNVLDQHQYFLDQYGLSAENPIPWMSPDPWCNWPQSGLPETLQPLDISTFTPWYNNPDPAKRPPQHRMAGYFRVIPRNDFISRPHPSPLNNGGNHWPWNGYLNWYDPATPRKLQYALQSDRECDFYPTLNRVHFGLAYAKEEGVIEAGFDSQTPSFSHYEVRLNDGPWERAGDHYAWRLRKSAVNRLEVRAINALGVTGKPSWAEVYWHYQAPYRPKDAAK